MKIVLQLIFPILCIKIYFNTRIFNLSGDRYRLIFWLLHSDLEKRGTYLVSAHAPVISICFCLSPPLIKQATLFKIQTTEWGIWVSGHIKKDNGTSARPWSCVLWVVQATRVMLGRPMRGTFTWMMTLTPTRRRWMFYIELSVGGCCLSYWLWPTFHLNKLTWKVAKAPLSFLMLALNAGFFSCIP